MEHQPVNSTSNTSTNTNTNVNTTNEPTFADYLNQHNAPGTVQRYLREIALFFSSVAQPEAANYNQIMAYLGQLRTQQANISPSLHALKKYYSYLVATAQRTDNPVQAVRLRDQKNRDIQLQDLFKPAELESLLDRNERYPLLKNRNRIIISLLIYQALTNGDIKELTLSDIHLEEGTIYIGPGRKTNSRTLKLQPKQVFWLMEYIHKDRPQLLKAPKNPPLAQPTNQLLLSKLGRVENGEGIGYLLETSKHRFPERKFNAKTIRQSVITNHLKAGKDLRVVQVFAGHKYSSTTEKYKQADVEVLKQEVLKYHPLK